MFVEPLVAHGYADEKALAAELARDDTASGKRHQVRCLAARPSQAVKAQAWAQLVESDSLSNALVEATIAGFAQPSQRELLVPYAEKYFASIERIWAERSIQIAMTVVKGLFPSLQDSPDAGGDRRVARGARVGGPGAASAGTGGARRPGAVAAGAGGRRGGLNRPSAPALSFGHEFR